MAEGTVSNQNGSGIVGRPGTPDPRSRKWKTLWAVANVIAIFFWSYAIIKIFLFDVDVYVISLASPAFVWVLNYKFLIFSGLIVIAMLVTKSLMLGLAVGYIAFYPLIVVFWKLPRFIWKKQSWLLLFAVLNSLIGLFRSFKRIFISTTLFLICGILILTADNQYVLQASSLTIFALLVTTYVMTFLRAFKPSAVFQTYKTIFPVVGKSALLKVDDSVRDLPIEVMSAKQLEMRTNSLQNVVLYNRICLLVSKKLRDYQDSGANVASYILTVVGLFLFVVISFALINYALYKSDQSLFQFTYSKKTFFAFIYYSAGSMFYAANGLVPIEALSQMVQLIQFFFALLLVVILITMVFALRNERYSIELEEVIYSVETEGRSAEARLLSEFRLGSIESAIQALQIAKAGFTDFILYLTKNLGE
jgi:hypothetical protein